MRDELENFINALMSIDNEIQKGIIEKIKKKQKLNEYENLYLIEMKKFIEREKAKSKGEKKI